jgi:RNA polymerase sigma-70 factor (family 1)
LSYSNISKDIVLLNGLRKGDHTCFKQLFSRYSQPLFRFSFSYLRSKEAAEDVVQETFIKVWDRRKDIDTKKSFQAYLFTIALNAVRKQFNKLSEQNQLKHDVLVSFAGKPEKMDNQENFEEMLKHLDHLIGQMPERRRIIFQRKKFQGKSQKEIAVEFNITTKTVEYHITEAMKFLKDRFAKLHLEGMIFFFLFLKNSKNIGIN